MTLTYVSLFSGIEAPSIAWGPLSWNPLTFAEIEPFPSAVLAHHFPDVPNLGDITKVDWSTYRDTYGQPDVLIAGAPCQAFSVAGLRKGTNDDRGNLTIETIRIVHELQPRYFIFENVPGILSDDTNAFGCLLAGLLGHSEPVLSRDGKFTSAGAGTGPKGKLAWRVLAAQHFGLAQRRKRVFFVFCPATTAGSPERVLLERTGMYESAGEGTEAGEGTTGTSTESIRDTEPLCVAPQFSERPGQQLPTSGGGQVLHANR